MKKILLYITFVLFNTLSLITANSMSSVEIDINTISTCARNRGFDVKVIEALKDNTENVIFTESSLNKVKTEYSKEMQAAAYNCVENKRIIALRLLEIITNVITKYLSSLRTISTYLNDNECFLNISKNTNILDLENPISKFYKDLISNGPITISGQTFLFEQKEIIDLLSLITNNENIKRNIITIQKLKQRINTTGGKPRRTTKSAKKDQIIELNNSKSIWIKRLTSKTVTIAIPIALYASFSIIKYLASTSPGVAIDKVGAFIYITAETAIASTIISSLNLIIRSSRWLWNNVFFRNKNKTQ